MCSMSCDQPFMTWYLHVSTKSHLSVRCSALAQTSHNIYTKHQKTILELWKMFPNCCFRSNTPVSNGKTYGYVPMFSSCRSATGSWNVTRCQFPGFSGRDVGPVGGGDCPSKTEFFFWFSWWKLKRFSNIPLIFHMFEVGNLNHPSSGFFNSNPSKFGTSSVPWVTH